MSAVPRAYLAAAPLQAAHVPTLTRNEGVRQLLENPPSARSAGWDLRTLDRASLVEGDRLRLSNGDRKSLDLLADGTFIAVAAFHGFLSWGPHVFPEDPKISGVALIEFTYEFVALYARLVAEYIEPRPAGVRFQIGIRQAVFPDGGGGETALYLNPGAINAFPPPVRPSAPGSSFLHRQDVTVDPERGIDVPVVAFELVRRFYNWFGHVDDAIPYTTPDGGAIDIEAIKALR
ncbi:MAG: hypothetical protein JWR63_3032 [Conexibacter sp.]|nr:hypothetical protein [Conexibacter sp.]